MSISLEKVTPKIRALIGSVEQPRGGNTQVFLADGLRLNLKLERDPHDPRGTRERLNWCKLPLAVVGEIREKGYSPATHETLDEHPAHRLYVHRVGYGTGRHPNEAHIEQVLRWADVVPCYCEGCVHQIEVQGEAFAVPLPNGTSISFATYMLRVNVARANNIDVNRRDAWKDVEAILNGTYVVPEPPAPEPVVVAEAEPVAEPVEIVASVETVQVVEVAEPVWSPYGIDVEVDPEFALPSLAELRARITEARAC